MQRIAVFRSLSVLVLAAAVAGCSPGSRSTGGRTPSPSQTTLAQANSTTPPDRPVTLKPSEKFFAKTGRDRGVSFALWANGSPLTVLTSPNAVYDMTGKLRGHANTLVVKWTKLHANSAGTLTIETRKHKVLTVRVRASSPKHGSRSKTFIAPQMPRR
jgi:hypothetical protein